MRRQRRPLRPLGMDPGCTVQGTMREAQLAEDELKHLDRVLEVLGSGRITRAAHLLRVRRETVQSFLERYPALLEQAEQFEAEEHGRLQVERKR